LTTRRKFSTPLGINTEVEIKHPTFIMNTATQNSTGLTADSDKFGQIVASLIQRLYLDGTNDVPPPCTRSLPLHIFISKTIKAVQLPEAIHFLAVYYMTQVRIKNPSVRMKPGMEYILVIACMILAQKVLDDYRWPNKAWARLTGLPLREINVMERELLGRLSYSLNVSEVEYVKWVGVLSEIAKKDEERLRLQAEQTERAAAAFAEMRATVCKSRKRLSGVYESDEECVVGIEDGARKIMRRSMFDSMILRSQLATPPMSP
jgi:hypothetical protein